MVRAVIGDNVSQIYNSEQIMQTIVQTHTLDTEGGGKYSNITSF